MLAREGASVQERVNFFAAAFFPHIIDDAFLDTVMAHVAESVRALDISGMKRRKAQRLIEDVACQAVCEMWTAAFPGRKYKPNRSWPFAVAIILDNPRRVVLEMWLGQDYQAAEIPEPVEIFLDGE